MKYIVEGGVSLKGSVKVFGAKNSSFKLMLAALLSDESSTISNICFIRDVISVKQLIESLGGTAEVGNNKTMIVSGKGLKDFQIKQEFGQKTRASSMFLPILLSRFKTARVPLPGGDNIGARSLDRHTEALKSLGAQIKMDGGFIEAQAPNGFIGTNYTFNKNTHTGTETFILAACLARGTSVLNNAAEEPEINDLISFLNLMGAKISRSAHRQITIQGVSSLKGADFELMPDRNDVVTFACAALATGGDILVEKAHEEHLKAFIAKVVAAGGGYEVLPEGIRFFAKSQLRATTVETAIHPGFMTDWQALWVTLMTQAEGESIVHERVFENRFGYVPDLQKMGAKIELFNPKVENPETFYEFNLSDVKENVFHAARITGPTKLHGASLSINDIRAGATLTLAALFAKGQSVIDNIELIERGYENLEGRLAELGANIVKRD